MGGDGESGGFICLHRKIFDNPLLQDGERFRAWCWLLGEAAWKPRRIRVSQGRGSQVVEVGRGQLSHSIRFLAKAWRWTPKRVRTFLADLENDGMIALNSGHTSGTETTPQTGTQSGTLQSIITVCNYAAYHGDPTIEGTPSTPQTGTPSIENGHKEEEEKKKKKDISPLKGNPLGWPLDAFEKFYLGYPKRIDRKDAQRAFAKVQAAGEVAFDALIAARDRYAEQVRSTERQYIKAPAVWLNKGSYLDEPARSTGDVIQLATPTRDPKTFTAQEWRSRIQMVADGSRWPAQWGPPPGEAGCLVPPELLTEAHGNSGRGAVA